jgi:hypothetical protein
MSAWLVYLLLRQILQMLTQLVGTAARSTSSCWSCAIASHHTNV